MNNARTRVGLTVLCGILALINAPIVFASAASLLYQPTSLVDPLLGVGWLVECTAVVCLAR